MTTLIRKVQWNQNLRLGPYGSPDPGKEIALQRQDGTVFAVGEIVSRAAFDAMTDRDEPSLDDYLVFYAEAPEGVCVRYGHENPLTCKSFRVDKQIKLKDLLQLGEFDETWNFFLTGEFPYGVRDGLSLSHSIRSKTHIDHQGTEEWDYCHVASAWLGDVPFLLYMAADRKCYETVILNEAVQMKAIAHLAEIQGTKDPLLSNPIPGWLEEWVRRLVD